MMKKRMCAWVWAVLFSCAMFPQRQRMDLQGKWAFKLDVRGNGEESGFATAPFAEEVVLPGTTDTNRKGFRPARTDETTYLTRLHAYVGKAWYKKVVDIPESWKNKVVTLTLERTKPTRVWVDGKEAGSRDGISVRQVYDLSRFLTPGRHEIAVRVDNGESIGFLSLSAALLSATSVLDANSFNPVLSFAPRINIDPRSSATSVRQYVPSR